MTNLPYQALEFDSDVIGRALVSEGNRSESA
jgi:hypothetical protein